MPEALVLPLLCALATLAAVLGMAANLLAARLLVALDSAANDPVYQTPRYACRPRIALSAVR